MKLRIFSVCLAALFASYMPEACGRTTSTVTDHFPAITELELADTVQPLLLKHGVVELPEEVRRDVLEQRLALYPDKELFFAVLKLLRKPEFAKIEELMLKQIGPFLNGGEEIFHPSTQVSLITVLSSFPVDETATEETVVLASSAPTLPGALADISVPVATEPVTIDNSLPTLPVTLKADLIAIINHTAFVSEQLANGAGKKKNWVWIGCMIGGAVVLVASVATLAGLWFNKRKKRRAAKPVITPVTAEVTTTVATSDAEGTEGNDHGEESASGRESEREEAPVVVVETPPAAAVSVDSSAAPVHQSSDSEGEETQDETSQATRAMMRKWLEESRKANNRDPNTGKEVEYFVDAKPFPGGPQRVPEGNYGHIPPKLTSPRPHRLPPMGPDAIPRENPTPPKR